MSYNGSGTFNINTTGQPVVAGTIISSASFNALTADLATGLTTAITKDGQTTATARIPFAQGINSTLVTDASSTTTGSIFTAGGVGIAKKLYVGTDVNIAGLTASSAVATDASKNLVSVTNTGTGSNVLATSPTITTATLASANLTTALTLAGAAGNSGQVLTSAGSGLPTWVTPTGGFILGTPVATTSGTSIDFTGIPAGVKQIVISFNGVSTNGTSEKSIQLGDAGGIETSGYNCTSMRLEGSGISPTSSTGGFEINSVLIGDTIIGSVILTLENSSTNAWAITGVLGDTSARLFTLAGRKPLSAVLDRVRLTTAGGVNTFDAGEINIAYI